MALKSVVLSLLLLIGVCSSYTPHHWTAKQRSSPPHPGCVWTCSSTSNSTEPTTLPSEGSDTSSPSTSSPVGGEGTSTPTTSSDSGNTPSPTAPSGDGNTSSPTSSSGDGNTASPTSSNGGGGDTSGSTTDSSIPSPTTVNPNIPQCPCQCISNGNVIEAGPGSSEKRSRQHHYSRKHAEHAKSHY